MKNLAKYIRCESITQAYHLFNDAVKEYKNGIRMTYRGPRILEIHFKSEAALYFVAECHWDSVMKGKQYYTEISGSEFEEDLRRFREMRRVSSFWPI